MTPGAPGVSSHWLHASTLQKGCQRVSDALQGPWWACTTKCGGQRYKKTLKLRSRQQICKSNFNWVKTIPPASPLSGFGVEFSRFWDCYTPILIVSTHFYYYLFCLFLLFLTFVESFLVDLWNILNIVLYLFEMFWKCLGSFGTILGVFWDMFGTFLDFVWNCLGSFGNIFGTILVEN